jgi:hypothetical protein
VRTASRTSRPPSRRAPKQIFAKNPFFVFAAFFPAVRATLAEALATPGACMVLPDLGELLQAFSYRFKGALFESIEAAATLLLQAVRSQSILAVEELRPLAKMALITPLWFCWKRDWWDLQKISENLIASRNGETGQVLIIS